MVTISLMAVCLIIFASILSWSFTNSTITQQNNQYNMSENAAEAAVERVIGQIDRDFISLSINGASTYASLPSSSIDQTSWPIQYTYSDTNGNPGVVTVAIGAESSTTIPLNSQYSGLQAYAQQVDVYATATPSGQRFNVPATVHESLQLANVPLFQFAIFYNVNLEVMSAAGLNIYGPVFCNQNIWEGSTVAVFYSTVTAVGTNCVGADDPFCDYVGSGASVFEMAGQPVNKANSLVMPIGTNNSPNAVMGILALPPPAYAMGTAAAYSSNGIVYPANSADLVITNFAFGTNDLNALPTGTNMFIYYQDNGLQQVPFDYYLVTNQSSHTIAVSNYVGAAYSSNIYFATYSFVTNSRFFDWREGYNNGSGPAKRVEAVDIDVNLLNKWLTNQSVTVSGYNYDQTKYNHSGHHIDSIYVYTSVPLTGTQLPAVRVKNGAALPNPPLPAVTQPAGLTVATQFPIYVLGLYNCQDNTGSAANMNGTNSPIPHTLPAALMGDAITLLSPSWTDGNSSANNISGGGTPTTGSSASTVNAAMLCGIVQSDPTKTGNVGMNGDYSGGVENFLRLLENWSGDTLTYNGSIVVLFYSQYGTNAWRQTGHYYSAPTRHWAFDLNFNTASKLPPLTPQIKAMIRGNWYAHQ
jgi:hypothetical protein